MMVSTMARAIQATRAGVRGAFSGVTGGGAVAMKRHANISGQQRSWLVRCSRMFRSTFLSVLLALIAGEAAAAASAVSLTPSKVSVLASTTQVFSVRFLDASGRPAVGETVQFFNAEGGGC